MQKELLEKIDNVSDDAIRKIVDAKETSFSRKPVKKARHIYADQIMCFSALTFMAVWKNGLRALLLVAISVAVSIVVDYICCAMSKKEYTYRDLSNIAAGMCIALLMPASISYGLAAAGAALAIGIKHIFGGKDNYIFNPTAVALAFLIICYPSKMLLFPKAGEQLPVFGEITSPLSSGIESFLIKLGTTQELSAMDVMLGNFQGAMGVTHILVILVCCVCLLFRKSISSLLTLTSMAVILIITSFFPFVDNLGNTMEFGNTLALEMIGGYMLFGLLFLANDPQTIPKSELGKVYYGVVLGVLTVLFRYFGKVEGSFVFALLVANVLSLQMDSAAEGTMRALHHFAAYWRKNLSSYETFRETVKTTSDIGIGDTQEIQINPTNYDMPPIDNKVTKINRKKPNLLKKTREKLGTISEKRSPKPIQPIGVVLDEPSQVDNEPKLELKKAVKLAKISSRPTRAKIKAFFIGIGRLIKAGGGKIALGIRKLKADKIPEVAEIPQQELAAIEEAEPFLDEAQEELDELDNDVEILDFEEVAELTSAVEVD